MFSHNITWHIYGKMKICNGEITLQSAHVYFNSKFFEVNLTDKPIINERFIDNQDGTVSDKEKGLMWMRACVGQVWEEISVSKPASLLSWNEACNLKETFAGYNDWRLPNDMELRTLVLCTSGESEQYAEHLSSGRCLGNFQKPTIDLDAFPACPSGWFWTSTLCDVSKNALYINFDNGATKKSLQSDKNYVRLVRVLK